jgi:trimethylamine--corrinoid protein Co-methyltransferase
MRYLRTEHYFPSDVINRQSRHGWETDGEKDARSRAKEIARHILAEHEPTLIDPDVDAWIKERFASSLVLVSSKK